MRIYFLIFLALLPFVQCENYSTSPFCNSTDNIRYPKNLKDVVSIVKEAIRRKVTVKAIGARHSRTDVICTEGIPVDMTKLKSFKMNADNVTATFGAGVTLEEASEFLMTKGRAFKSMPAFQGITIGGATGTGAHGSSLNFNATLSAQILTDGTAVRLAKTSDQVMLHWFPSFEQVVVANFSFVPADTPGTAYTNLGLSSYGFYNSIMKKAKEIMFDLTSSECPASSSLGNEMTHVFESIAKSAMVEQRVGVPPFYTEDGIHMNNPAVGYPHKMLATTCNEGNAGLLGKACAWAHEDINSALTFFDSEIAIPLSKLEHLVSTVRDIRTKTPVAFPDLGLIMRFSGKSDIYMSTGYQRDTIHVEFTIMTRTDSYNDASGCLAGYQTILQELVKNMSGRSHWGKTGTVYHSTEMMDMQLDSQAREDFVAAMNKFDPNEKFLNNFGRRLKATGTKIDADPNIKHCALLDNCLCSVDADCAETQRCISLPGYERYPVCKTRYEIARRDCNKIPFLGVDLFRYLSVTLPTLVTKAFAKCSLPISEQ